MAHDITTPCVRYGLPYDDYASAPGVRATWLETFERCPVYAKWVRDHPGEPVPALILGSAAHTLTLEPHVFNSLYVKSPKFDRRTKAGKADAAAFADDNANRTVLRDTQYDELQCWRDAIWSHPQARELLSCTGANEVSVWVTDPDTGLLRKSRDDRHSLCNMGMNVLVDLKTTSVLAKHGPIDREIAKRNYHSKAAFHLDNAKLAIPGRWEYRFIFVEKTPPYMVAVYPLAADALEQGRRDYTRWLRTCAKCLETGVWPGYEYDGEEVSIPGWAFDKDDVFGQPMPGSAGEAIVKGDAEF